jgi:hypothetical protein
MHVLPDGSVITDRVQMWIGRLENHLTDVALVMHVDCFEAELMSRRVACDYFA